jgi:hypothetical protein
MKQAKAVISWRKNILAETLLAVILITQERAQLLETYAFFCRGRNRLPAFCRRAGPKSSTVRKKVCR